MKRSSIQQGSDSERKGNIAKTDVITIAAEDFINELIDSICRNNREDFRHKYIEAEELTILDFNFLTNCEASMEEFEKIRRVRKKYGRRTILR